MALTKADMVDYLFEQIGLTKLEAKDLVELFFEEIRVTLERGEPVKLSGFGNFDLREKRERPGRNPKTGEEIPITARRVVTFHPGQRNSGRRWKPMLEPSNSVSGDFTPGEALPPSPEALRVAGRKGMVRRLSRGTYGGLVGTGG